MRQAAAERSAIAGDAHSIQTAERVNLGDMTQHFDEAADGQETQPANSQTSPFSQRPPIWSMRTVAAASVLSVALAAGGGAALASMSDGSADGGFGRGGNPTGLPGSNSGPSNSQPGQGTQQWPGAPQGSQGSQGGGAEATPSDGSVPRGTLPERSLPDGSVPDMSPPDGTSGSDGGLGAGPGTTTSSLPPATLDRDASGQRT